MTMHQNRKAHTDNRQTGFNGAAIITAQGEEVPITEDMIQRACEHLESRWHYPANQRSAG